MKTVLIFPILKRNEFMLYRQLVQFTAITVIDDGALKPFASSNIRYRESLSILKIVSDDFKNKKGFSILYSGLIRSDVCVSSSFSNIIIIMNFYSPVSNTKCHSIGHKIRIA